MVVLETERLVLRPMHIDDFEAFAAMSADSAVMEFLGMDGKPATRFVAWQGFCSWVGHWQLKGFGMFAVIERSTGTFVGRIGPWYPETWPDFEIGWTLCSPYWGRGYASEAAQACLQYSFEQLGRSHVISLIRPENVRSVRVAERLGERLEGEALLPHVPPGMTVLLYGMSKADWAGRR